MNAVTLSCTMLCNMKSVIRTIYSMKRNHIEIATNSPSTFNDKDIVIMVQSWLSLFCFVWSNKQNSLNEMQCIVEPEWIIRLIIECLGFSYQFRMSSKSKNFISFFVWNQIKSNRKNKIQWNEILNNIGFASKWLCG